MNTIISVIRKEFLQLRRDRKMLPIVIIAPVLQLVLLGYAANLDVRDLRLAVYDSDRSAASRALISEFLSTDYFIPAGEILLNRDVEAEMLSGRADIVLVIPASFEENLTGVQPVQIPMIIDGSNSSVGTAALNYSSMVIQRFLARRAPDPQNARVPVSVEPRIWFNPELDTGNYMIPGILALLLMVITMMLSSLAIVKEKELGTLEQLNVTPIKPWQLIVGKLIPFVLIGLVDVLLVVLVARGIFAVPFRGSLLLLFGMSIIFLATTLGLGLFISSVSQTQQQAMMTSVFFLMLPMIFLSGFAFPIESMPRFVQWVTYLLPLRYYFVIIRGIFLKGAGLAVLWDEGLALLVSGVIFVVIGALGFRKRAT